MGHPVVVELDEDPGPPAPHGPAEGRRWRWVVPVIAVALALVVAQLVADALERARVASLAQLPGVLAPLPTPVRAAWRASDDALGVTRPDPDVALEQRVADDGALVLTARASTTGAVRWTVPLLDPPDPPLPPTAVRYGLQCAHGPGLPGRVACLAHDATALRTPAGASGGSVTTTATSRPATTAVLTVVDTGTGEVVARRPATAGTAVAATLAVVGEAVVLAAPLDVGTSAWAVEPGADAPRWQVRAATGVGGGWLRWGAQTGVVPVGDDAVAVLGAGTVLLDAGDGSVLSSAGTLATVLGARPDGTALVVGTEGITRLLDGGDDVRLDGVPVLVTIDDGSVPHLGLTSSGGLRAWDAATGEALWRAEDVVGVEQALVVGNRVHVHDGYRITTLAGDTGQVLWETSAPEVVGERTAVMALETDGARVLVVGRARDRSMVTLAALDAADGTLVWRQTLRDVSEVTAVDGLLLARTAQGVVVLR